MYRRIEVNPSKGHVRAHGVARLIATVAIATGFAAGIDSLPHCCLGAPPDHQTAARSPGTQCTRWPEVPAPAVVRVPEGGRVLLGACYNCQLPSAGPVIYVDASAAGANDGTSWTDAFTDLEDALHVARLSRLAAGLQSQVWVADGTYRPSFLQDPPDPRSATFQLVNDVALYGGFAGGEPSLSERNPAADAAILSGDLAGNDGLGGDNTENAYHVVSGNQTDSTATLDGFTITGGNADGPIPSFAHAGGGLLIVRGAPTIVNCKFLGNAALFGGGMANSFGNPTVTNGLFSGNLAAVDGGGMFNDDFSRPTLSQCTFSLNMANGGGGGIKDGPSGVNSPRLTNCILWGNTADADGDAGGPYTDGDAQIDSESSGGGVPVVHYSCIKDLPGATLVGNGNIGENPQFMDADGADNTAGTLDDHLELSRFSPCVDAGDSKAVPLDVTDTDGDADTTERLPRDLASKNRLIDDAEVPDTGRGFPPVVDMGAYEHVPDCNGNGIADSIDVASTSEDCNANRVPDECEIDVSSPAPGGPFYCPTGSPSCDPDCNENGIPDACDLPDCNQNGVPDSCDMIYCTGEPWCADCNANGQLDQCDVAYCPGLSACDDCNANNVPDLCDIMRGTSQDSNGDGVPDECVHPIMSGMWTDGQVWDLFGGYPDNIHGVPNLHVTVDDDILRLNATVEIESLRLNPYTALNLDWPVPLIGDLSTRTGYILTYGSLRVVNHNVLAGGMSISDGGVLNLDGTAAIDLAGGPLDIGFAGLLEPIVPLAPIQGSITAGRIGMSPTYCGAESQITVTDGMVVSTDGDFLIDGRDVQCLFPPPQGRNLARGGKTPPILRISGPQYSWGAVKDSRRTPAVSTPLLVGGNLRILNAGNVCVGCEAIPCFCHYCYPSACEAYTRSRLAGHFDNGSRYASLYNWANGGMLLVGGTVNDPLVFEVAGIDLGPVLEGFQTGAETNTESFVPGTTHTNFSMGIVELADGAQVTFKNEHVNTVGSAGCSEALYTRVFKVGAGAAVELADTNVYYEVLEAAETATVTQSGCGKLREVCWGTPGPGDYCQTDILVAQDGLNDFSNICASTDGPSPVECENGSVDFGLDVWYAYTATCSGTLTVNMCDTVGFNGILAVYTDGNNTCECPTDASTQLGPGNDDGCGVEGGPPTITTQVQEGVCYTIRIGGRESSGVPGYAGEGQGQFQLICGCIHADPPVAEPTVPDVGFGTRVRYLAFSPNAQNAGRTQAIRVSFTDLPPPFQYANGRVMWVGPPSDVSEVAGKSDATPPTFKLSGLQCDPFYADWTQYGTVYARSENLVPRGLYDVQAIDTTCSLLEEASYSQPLPVKLSKWGDTVGGSNPQSPQGTVDFTDISSVVDKFKNLATAPTKSRVDLAPSLPDRIVDFVDIPSVVDAFKGRPYPYAGPPIIDPCNQRR